MFNVVPYNFKSRDITITFDKLFEDLFDIFPRSREWRPPVDFSEDDESYRLSLELPGVNKEQLEINVENNILTISGEKKNERQGDERRIERYYGRFARSFSVPESVDKEKISAKFENGVLELTIPKTPAVKPKKIDIK